jgi:hypothetical protein
MSSVRVSNCPHIYYTIPGLSSRKKVVLWGCEELSQGDQAAPKRGWGLADQVAALQPAPSVLGTDCGSGRSRSAAPAAQKHPQDWGPARRRRRDQAAPTAGGLTRRSPDAARPRARVGAWECRATQASGPTAPTLGLAFLAICPVLRQVQPQRDGQQLGTRTATRSRSISPNWGGLVTPATSRSTPTHQLLLSPIYRRHRRL